jgi:uncharacterized protein (TIGR02145 family)
MFALANINMKVIMTRKSLVTTLVTWYVFNTSPAFCQTITDIDGNVYQTITIGNQIWMAENLKVTHYRNGDAIPYVIGDPDWRNLTTGAYFYYDYNASNAAVYGCLYNWYAVHDSRNIAPTGWHIPTDEEWKTLEKYLGMSQASADATVWRGTDEGGKLKENGLSHWLSPNTGATNESCFSALPGGYRESGGGNDMGYSAYFWSSTESSVQYEDDLAWNRLLSWSNSQIRRYTDYKTDGFSVRLVSDVSLPVGLTSISACVKNRSVIINWITESEVDNLGFILERSEEDGIWVQVASYQTHDALKGQSNTSSRTEYTFTDVNVESGKEYFYRLSDVSTTDKITCHAPISVSLKTDEHPQITEMRNAYPNPFNPKTYITYQLAEATNVKITVFDMLGRSINELNNGHQPAGSYHVYWNGTNETGIMVPSGCYIIRMETEAFKQIQKVIFMK